LQRDSKSEKVIGKIESAYEKKMLDDLSKTEQLETVMNSGMQFLAGLFKMTTGKDLGLENQKVEVDKKTGEIIMRFKIPL
jgi:hypothetical protein